MKLTAAIANGYWTEPIDYIRPEKKEGESEKTYEKRVWLDKVRAVRFAHGNGLDVSAFIEAEAEYFL